MAGTREHDDHAPIRRGRLGDEGQGTGEASRTRNNNVPLSPNR
ncbi:MAG: hypothetical protein ACXW0T_08500 [Methylobacter sp.]